MPNSAAMDGGKILHLRRSGEIMPQRNGSVHVEAIDEVEQECSEAGVRYEACFDPYRALARIGRSAEGEIVGVVVDLDALAFNELEFFGHARRLRPVVVVLVRTARKFDPRLTQAMQLGATAELSSEALDRLLHPVARDVGQKVDAAAFAKVAQRELIETAQREAQRFAAQTPVEPTQFEEVEGHVHKFGQAEVGDTSAQETEAHDNDLIEQDEEAAAYGSESDEAGEQESPNTVRVPWLRYSDAPTRTAPQRVPPVQQRVPPAKTAAREPLLSAEELRALMDDDWPEAAEETQAAEKAALHDEDRP